MKRQRTAVPNDASESKDDASEQTHTVVIKSLPEIKLPMFFDKPTDAWPWEIEMDGTPPAADSKDTKDTKESKATSKDTKDDGFKPFILVQVEGYTECETCEEVGRNHADDKYIIDDAECALKKLNLDSEWTAENTGFEPHFARDCHRVFDTAGESNKTVIHGLDEFLNQLVWAMAVPVVRHPTSNVDSEGDACDCPINE